MSLALLMPGQGSQKPGMGIDFYRNYNNSKKILSAADQLLQWDLIDLLENGSVEQLSRTKYCQPAIYAVSCAIAVNLIDLPNISMISGHSLGQFAAAHLSGAFSFEDGLKVVVRRAELMDKFSNSGEFGMAAILGLERDIIEDIVSGLDGVYCANFNSPQQVVISGRVKDLQESEKLFVGKGAKRVVLLNVSGAFHSPYMEDANQEFLNILDEVTFTDPSIPLVSNKNGAILRSADSIKDEFQKQMVNHVDWIAVIETLAKNNISRCIEVGPGNVLTGLIKRIDKSMALLNIENTELMENFLKEFDYELT